MTANSLDPWSDFHLVSSSSSGDEVDPAIEFCLVASALSVYDISNILEEWRNLYYCKTFHKIDWVLEALKQGIVPETFFFLDVDALISLALEKSCFEALIKVVEHQDFRKLSSLCRVAFLNDAMDARAPEKVIASIVQRTDAFDWRGVKGVTTREKLIEIVNGDGSLIKCCSEQGYTLELQAALITKMANEAGFSALEIGFALKYPSEKILIFLLDQGAGLQEMEGCCYFDAAISEGFYSLAESILDKGFELKRSAFEEKHCGVLHRLCSIRENTYWRTNIIFHLDALIIKAINSFSLEYLQERDTDTELLDLTIDNRWENIALALINKISNSFPHHKLNHFLYKLISKRMSLAAIGLLRYSVQDNPRMHDLIHTLHDAIKMGMNQYSLELLKVLHIRKASSFIATMAHTNEIIELTNISNAERYLFKCSDTALEKGCHAISKILLSEEEVPDLTSDGAETYQKLRSLLAASQSEDEPDGLDLFQ